MYLRIGISPDPYTIGDETRALLAAAGTTGAIVSFTGYVRDYCANGTVRALWLEHYPGMTERCLEEIAQEAGRRWSLQGLVILHRVGELQIAERIVTVLVASAHRREAFESCEFVMDYLKTRAPFWKKERFLDDERSHWVQQKDTDLDAASRWES